MKFFSKKNKGFSLIELLVVVTVITLLATISAYSLKSARIKGRDTKRIADMSTINLALHAYFNDHGSFPTSINFGQPFTNVAGTKTYIEQIPTNPTPRTDHNCPDREYVYRISPTDDKSYSLIVCTGVDTNASKPKLTYSTEEGIYECGDVIFDLENNSYKTVSIGNQCWMAQNLKTKIKPDGTCIMNGGQPPCPDAEPNTTLAGRTCWNYVESNCTWNPAQKLDGALYFWDAAMNGSTTEGAQGICPIGWHVPSDNDWYILESFLTNAGQTCDANRIDPPPSTPYPPPPDYINPGRYCTTTSCGKCTGSGTNLLYPNGSSGFNAIMNGYYGISGSILRFLPNNPRYITSTENGSSQYRMRMFWPNSLTAIWRVNYTKLMGASLRCVKD